MTLISRNGLTRRSLLKTSALAAAGTLATPALLRAQSSELVVGCAGSHTAWMEALVVPHMKKTLGADILFEGTKSSVNLEKMASNRDNPYLSVVQMDDPVMIQLCMGIPYGAPDDPGTLLALVNQLPSGSVFSAFSIGLSSFIL